MDDSLIQCFTVLWPMYKVCLKKQVFHFIFHHLKMDHTSFCVSTSVEFWNQDLYCCQTKWMFLRLLLNYVNSLNTPCRIILILPLTTMFLVKRKKKGFLSLVLYTVRKNNRIFLLLILFLFISVHDVSLRNFNIYIQIFVTVDLFLKLTVDGIVWIMIFYGTYLWLWFGPMNLMNRTTSVCLKVDIHVSDDVLFSNNLLTNCM